MAPPSTSRSLALVGVISALSLAANAYLLLREPAHPSSPAQSPDAGPGVASGRLAAIDASAKAPSKACAAELARCRATAWRLVGRVLGSHAQAGVSPPDAGAVAANKAPAGREASDARAQARFRAQLALKHFRLQWQLERDKTTKRIVSDLANAEQLRKQAARQVDAFAKLIKLGEPEKRLLAESYRPISRRHLEGVHTALSAKPVDYLGALGQLRGLFAAEDALALRLFGNEARDRLRADQLHTRTAILAIVAAFADIPWNDPRLIW